MAVRLAASIRLAAESEVVREAVPRAAAPAFEAATRLGNPLLLTFALALLYWAGRRRRTATVVAYAFGALGVVLALKQGLAMPRPPESVRLIAVDGYGFPSGHAVAAVVVYGGLALEFDRLTDPRWAGATLATIAAIGLSRVVLGVHYLGDVLVGLAVGAVVLGVARLLSEGDPRVAFGLAALAGGVPAVAITGGAASAVGALGGCLGGVLGSLRMGAIPEDGSRREFALLAVVGLPFVVLVQVAGDALAGSVVLAGLDDLVLVAGVILLPAAFERVDAVERVSAVVGD